MDQHLDREPYGEALEIARARTEYDRARRRLDQTRLDLLTLEEEREILLDSAREIPGPGGLLSSPIRRGAVKGKTKQEAERAKLWHRYLNDFEWYLRAKMAYRRLKETRDRDNLLRASQDAAQLQLLGGETVEEVGWEAVLEDEGSLRREVKRELLDDMQRALEKLTTEEPFPTGFPEDKDQVFGPRRRERDVQMVIFLLQKAQGLGVQNEPSVKGALEKAGAVMERLARKAEADFWENCTAENFKVWSFQAVALQLFGRGGELSFLGGRKRTAAGGSHHITQSGDTLAKIAVEYFGDRCAWAAIYANNLGLKLDSDPDKILPPRTAVTIP